MRKPHVGSSWDALALAAAMLISALTTYWNLRANTPIGSWEDDGVYLVTAKALAEGAGYRRLDLPNEPYQTKYPILYSLVLAPLWRIFPEFPANLAPMQILNGLFGCGAGCLAYRLARRAWGLPPWLAAAGMSAALALPGWADLGQYTMSELFYALLSLAALNCLQENTANSPTAAEKTRRDFAWAGLHSGFWAAAAYLCRSIGVTIIAAVLISWLLRRQWRAAALAALLPALAIVSWNGWRQTAIAANAEKPQAAALRFDLDYSAWAPRDLRTISQVAWLNTPAFAWGVMGYLLEPPTAWTDRAARGDTAQGDLPFTILIFTAALLVLAALLVGLCATFHRKSCGTHLYLFFYIGLVLVWPFQPDRFLIPILPLLGIAALTGIWRVLRGLSGIFSLGTDPIPSTTSESIADSAPPAALVHEKIMWRDRAILVLAILLLLHGLEGNYQRTLGVAAEKLETLRRERGAVVELLTTRTPPEAVIAGAARGYFFLMTGRKFVPLLPYDNPVTLYFPADRGFLNGGRRRWDTPGGVRAFQQEYQTRCLAYCRAAGVNYVCLPGGGLEAHAFNEFSRRHPDQFLVLDNVGPYRLWRVQPD